MAKIQKKLLLVITKCIKVTVYKVNTQNQLYLHVLATNN